MPVLLILFGVTPDATYWAVFFPLSQFCLFFCSFFLGASFLASERYQQGSIYLLSLPYSRGRLFWIKVVPRTTAALVLFGCYTVLFHLWGGNLDAIPFFAFALIYFSLYAVSLTFSLSSDNFLVLFFLSAFGLAGFWGLQLLFIRVLLWTRGYVFYEVEVSAFFSGELEAFSARLLVLGTALLALPLLAAFGLAFRRFDVRPARRHNLRLIRWMLTLLVLGFCAALLAGRRVGDPGIRSFTLTRDHFLIESHEFAGLRVYDESRRHRIETPWPWFDFLFEAEGRVFALGLRGLFGIEAGARTIAPLYACPPGRSIIWGSVRLDAGTLVFLTRRLDRTGSRLEILERSGGGMRSIPLVHGRLHDFTLPTLFAADAERDRRFWLLSIHDYAAEIYRVFRISEDGTVRYLTESRLPPCYVNRLLLLQNDEKITLARLEKGALVPAHEIPNPEGYLFGADFSRRRDLGNHPVREMVGWTRVKGEGIERSPRFGRLDLETFDIEYLENMRRAPFLVEPDFYYDVEWPVAAGSALRISRFCRGKFIPLLTIPDVDIDGAGKTDLSFSGGGLILERTHDIEVYAFPDLEELTFRRLR
jgi:hypothetical protein